MNKLLIKTLAQKIIKLLGYKTPEYAYVRVTETSKKNMYNDEFQR